MHFQISISKHFFLVLIFTVFLKSIEAQWNTNDYLKKEHTLIKPYQAGGMSIPNWDFTGTTIITSNYVRLTADLQSQSGSIWNKVPVQARNWQLEVHFRVSGKSTDLFGDGMAIWYAKDPLTSGPVFGSKDQFFGLGVFLDTYANQNGPHNHGHPYISAMINNGSLQYDHDRDGTHTEVAGCETKFRGKDEETYLAIRYEHDTVTVYTDIEGKRAWKECFTVKGIRLPTGYYIGASAATGELHDSHDILYMKLYELELPYEPKDEEDRSKIEPSASFFAPPRDHVDDPPPPMSGTRIFVYIVLAIIGIVVCVIVGIMIFQKKQETSKRLF